jgi:hypothetical protein
MPLDSNCTCTHLQLELDGIGLGLGACTCSCACACSSSRLARRLASAGGGRLAHKAPLAGAVGQPPHLQSLNTLNLLQVGNILYNLVCIQQFAIKCIRKKRKESLLFACCEAALCSHLLHIHPQTIQAQTPLEPMPRTPKRLPCGFIQKVAKRVMFRGSACACACACASTRTRTRTASCGSSRCSGCCSRRIGRNRALNRLMTSGGLHLSSLRHRPLGYVRRKG